MAQELVFEDGVPLIDDRTVEVFMDVAYPSARLHVGRLMFEAYPPDRHGQMVSRIGPPFNGKIDPKAWLHTGDRAVRDAAALALEAAVRRGAGAPAA